jgi:capsular polysaccharide biosynthesis protein
MKLENIKLIHTRDDIPIEYNNNEHNFENVFILDSSNRNIERITYACPIKFDLNIIDRTIEKSIILPVENIFLFYSFMYQIAFGHFVEQCLPKINFYLKLKNKVDNLKFCIPKKRYNLITQNIVKIFNICEDDLIILDHDVTICAKNLFYNNYDCADLNDDKIETFNLIREKILISKNLMPTRNVYVKRNTEVILNTDCYNIGKTRQIVNEELLLQNLKKMNFEIITLGESDIYDKCKLLSNINILITQIGGNMYNLVFSNVPRHIIFLSNNSSISHAEYINNLLPKMKCYTHHSMIVFTHKSYVINCDAKNPTNDSFEVNINNIIKHCEPILLADAS